MKTSTDKAKEYAALLRSRLGGHVQAIVPFGSQARGAAHEGPDFDFLVVVDARTRPVREAVLDAGVAMLDKYDQLFGALLYSEEEWRESSRFPLGWMIQREGVAL
jgi:predicted nucleotidyltransferase